MCYEIFKEILVKISLLTIGLVLGLSISLGFACSWNNTFFLQTAVNQNRVLKPSEINKIKENLDYLKNDSGANTIKDIRLTTRSFEGNIGCAAAPSCQSDYISKVIFHDFWKYRGCGSETRWRLCVKY